MHYLMDAIYGVFLAFGSYGVAWFVFESRSARVSRPEAAAPGPVG